jgi:hypothetical protein
MARVVVAGYMVRHPLAGNLFAYFHYLLGLSRLGHEVTYIEESGWPQSCYDPQAHAWTDDPRRGLTAVGSLLREFRLDVPVYYVDRGSGRTVGGSWAEIKRVLREADVLVNVGGVSWLPEFRLCRRRVLIDMDPLFTQLGRFGAEALHEHHVHFSYGGNVGRADCSVPDAGVDWRPLPPPVVPDAWRVSNGGAASHNALTTIANWSAYGSVNHNGKAYGQKDEEFLRLLELPRRTSQPLELALAGIDDVSATRLRKAGWSVRDGGEVSTDVPTYRRYIATSRGELSVAKHAYVATRSGWFSDRSVCYLAAGLPVILQDTGFGDWLPAGRGVLTFSCEDEAAACIEEVNANYELHRNAAADVARRIFSFDVVLPRILEAVAA